MLPHTVRTAMIMGLPFSLHLRARERGIGSVARYAPETRSSTRPSRRSGRSSAGPTGCSAPTARTATSAGSGAGSFGSGMPTPRSPRCWTSPKSPAGSPGEPSTCTRRVPSIRRESSRAGRPPVRPAHWPGSMWTTTSMPAGMSCSARDARTCRGGSASNTPTTRAACSRSSNSPSAASPPRDRRTAAATSGIRRPATRREASRRPPSSAHHWSGRTCWPPPWSPAGWNGSTTPSWPPGHEVMLVTDEGAVLASSGFPALLAPDVPAPAFVELG